MADPKAFESDPTKDESKLLLESSVRGFFEQVVEETLAARRERPEPVVEQYLIGLLEDAAVDDSVVGQAVGTPLSLALAEALSAPAAVRFERLRQLGDGILLVGGLYQPHLSRAGLEDRYVAAVGGRAYHAASAILGRPEPSIVLVEGEAPRLDVLSALATRFGELMLLLRDVADTMVVKAAHTPRDLARLLERWLDGRSEHLGRLLRGQGVVLGLGTS